MVSVVNKLKRRSMLLRYLLPSPRIMVVEISQEDEEHFDELMNCYRKCDKYLMRDDYKYSQVAIGI